MAHLGVLSFADAMELDEETKGEVNGGAESGEEEEKVEDNWGQDLPLAGQSMAAALQLLSYTVRKHCAFLCPC